MTALLDVAKDSFQMQSWDSSAHCTCDIPRPGDGHRPKCPYPTATYSWVPMENGPASSHWKPKRTAEAAVRHAAAWSGANYGIGIPAMQVVDLATGEVVWRSSEHYPDAGDPIAPPWQAAVYAAANGDCEETPTPPAKPDPEPEILAAAPEPELTLF